MHKYCTVTVLMAVSMLPVIVGCAEPPVDAPLQLEAESLAGRADQTPPPPAEPAKQTPSSTTAEPTQQPAKKSVVNSLLRAVTNGVADALDDESPHRPPPTADSPTGD